MARPVIVGILVWGLIFIVPFVYRRKKGDTHTPVQVRYHLPIEVFYTIVPVMMVIVMFFFTVKVQTRLSTSRRNPTTSSMSLVSSGPGPSTTLTHQVLVRLRWHHRIQTDLVVGQGQAGGVQLTSPDVIHSFWVPAFIFKLDVVPGVTIASRSLPTPWAN
ncbi:MAG: hypothetical protein R2709_15085 [Marmoricola sp.]